MQQAYDGRFIALSLALIDQLIPDPLLLLRTVLFVEEGLIEYS